MRKKQRYTQSQQKLEAEDPIIKYITIDAEPEETFNFRPPMPKSFDHVSREWVDSSEIWNRYNTPGNPTGSSMAMDSRIAYDNQFNNNYASQSLGYLGQSYKLLVNVPFVGQGVLTQFAQNNLLASICKKKADQLTNKWIEFTSSSLTTDNKDADKNKKIIERIKDLEGEFERLKVQHWVREAVENCYKFGGCLLYPKLKGDDEYIGGEYERGRELIIEKIGIGDVEYLQVVEPLWITGINWVSDDPLSEWFYRPERWLVMGKILHESRALHFIYNTLPDILKPTYQFMGLSLIQQLMYDANHYFTAKNEQIKVTQKLKFMILEGTDLRAIGNNQAQNGTLPLNGRVQIAQQQLKNGDIVTLGGTEKMSSLQYDIGGLPEVVRQNAELMCATAGMSALDLFGFTPTGFSSIGEFELNSNYDNIRSAQKNIAHCNVFRLMQICMMNLWGEIDEDITFKWVNLEIPDEKQQAEINSLKAEVDALLYDRDLISGEDIINRLNADIDSGYEGLTTDSLDLKPDDIENLAQSNREYEEAK
jgi:phage-related protein (TIGR01555 family)